MKPNPRELDNESLAKLLDDEARFRPVYNGDMAPVMREAAQRLRMIVARDAFITQRGLWHAFISWVGTPEAETAMATLGAGSGRASHAAASERAVRQFLADVVAGRIQSVDIDGVPHAVLARREAATPTVCTHCQKPEPADCPFDACPVGSEF